MGRSTIGKVSRQISQEEVLEVSKRIYKDAKFVKSDDNVGWVMIEYKGEIRDIFIYTKEEYTSFSLSTWGQAVELITELLEYFGGDLIADDCSDEPSKFIFKTQELSEDEKANIILLTELHKIFPLNNDLVKKLIDNKDTIVNILTNIK